MDPTATRSLGRTGIRLTQLGFGGASIGAMWTPIAERSAVATVRAAWDRGIRYFDTAPWYGRGLSELRIGAGLREHSSDEFVLSTKVGRWLRAPDARGFDPAPWRGGLQFDVVFDYSYDGIMRSIEQSQIRLGRTAWDLVAIHDLDSRHHGSGEALEAHFGALVHGGLRALEELKAAGVARAIGAGISEPHMIPRFLDLFDMDFFLVAMPYTLLHQEILDDELRRCEELGVGIVIGAVFQSGILATGATPEATYNYGPVPAEIAARVARIEAICGRHDVSLGAAALQFPLGHPSVASVIPGALAPAQVARNVELFRTPIPSALWQDLKANRLLHPGAPVPA